MKGRRVEFQLSPIKYQKQVLLLYSLASTLHSRHVSAHTCPWCGRKAVTAPLLCFRSRVLHVKSVQGSTQSEGSTSQIAFERTERSRNGRCSNDKPTLQPRKPLHDFCIAPVFIITFCSRQPVLGFRRCNKYLGQM